MKSQRLRKPLWAILLGYCGILTGIVTGQVKLPAGLPPAITTPQEVQALEKGKIIEGRLAKDESRTFALHLEQGQYLNLMIEQQDFDVTVVVTDPDNREVMTVDSANRMRGPERIELTAEASGVFKVRVKAAKYGSSGGQYKIQLIELRASSENERRLWEARKLHDASVVLKDKGEYDNAIKLAGQALDIRERLLGKEHLDVATSLNDQGEILNQKGEYAKAEEAYKRALSIRENALDPLDPDIAVSLNGLGFIYYANRKYDQSLPLLQRALRIWEKALGIHNPNVGEPLDSIGGIYEARGEFSNAEEAYLRALAVRENGLDPLHPAIAASLNNLALLYVGNGRYSKAEPLYSRALQIVEETQGKDHPNAAFMLNNLAMLFRVKGNYTEAEPLYQRALKIREKQPGTQHPDYGASLNNLAMVYNAKGDYDKAEPLFVKALGIFEAKLRPGHPLTATAVNNLAVLYTAKGNYTKAEEMYKRALTARETETPPQPLAVAISLDNLALLYMQQGEIAKAEPLLDRARDVEKKLDQDHPEVARTNTFLGLLHYSKGDYRQAEEFLRRALLIRTKVFGSVHPDVASSFGNLALVYEAEGDVSDAIEARVSGNDISETNIELNLSTGSQRQKLLFLDTLSSETNATVSLHALSAPTNPAALNLAFTTVLRRKGRALEAMTDSINTLRQRLDPETQRLIDDLTDTRSYLASLFVRGPGRMPPAQYQETIQKLQGRIDDLEGVVSRRSMAFQAQSQTQPVTLDLVRGAMPANSTLVEFILYKSINSKAKTVGERVGASRYAAYLLPSKGSPTWVPLGEAKKIDDSINLLRAALRDPTRRDDVKPLSRKLDEMVMVPVRKVLADNSTVLIAPDGLLNLVPFGALVDDQGKFLIERYSFVYLTSGRDLLRMKVKVPSNQPATVFANPDFGPPTVVPGTDQSSDSCLVSLQWKQLPGTASQAKALETLLPGAAILTDRQPTEAAIKSVIAPEILHVATHGFFLTCNDSGRPSIASAPDTMGGALYRAEDQLLTNDHPSNALENALLRSGLVLTDANLHKSGNDDGILTALEAASLNLWGTKLVVLSACDTGVGEVKGGEGVYGLRRALALAGTESQIMSLWQVSDKPTRDLMVGYYRLLKMGQGRGEALRQVQLCMSKSQTRWHPYYWAGFIQSGDWTSLTTSPKSSTRVNCSTVFR
jgi:CHAT domain-containing protein/Tfp pilus assembly protein PilF